MALYRRVFSIADIATVHHEFARTIRLAETVEAAFTRAGRPGAYAATLRVLLDSYLEFNRGLDRVADRAAVDAKADILRVLKTRRKRPDTGQGPHLRGAIICRPIKDFGTLGTGEVGIADIDRLDRVVNPFGPQYGPYWRAIEEGTTKHVGRQVHGAFFGKGLGSGPFAPSQADFRRHPVFVTSAQGRGLFADAGFQGGFGKQGGGGGRRMTIGRPIEPQHFIRDGADAAEVVWRAGIAAVQARAIKQLQVVAGAPPRLRP